MSAYSLLTVNFVHRTLICTAKPAMFFNASQGLFAKGRLHMNGNCRRVLLMSMLVIVAGAPALLAQRYEVHPYGGFVWPNHTSVGAIKDQVIWGVKGGYFFDPSFELEGTFGYLNQFEVRRIDPESRGRLWELSGNYNFSAKDW